ncbi:MAG: DNA-binding protein [Thermoplasmata archaeon]|nr:MAG: DNA-binding protein [Thermoplasmata archaeon]
MSDAEEIKRRMLEEMQRQAEEEQRRQVEEEMIKAQKRAILRHLLDSEARGRLERIRMASPEKAEYIENQIIRLYQMGRIKTKITDEAFKVLISHLMPKKRDIKIRRI